MLDKQKVEFHLKEHFDDDNSEKDRFIKDFLILIEFGHFDAEDKDDDFNGDPYA